MREEWGIITFTSREPHKRMGQKHPNGPEIFAHIQACSIDDLTCGETFYVHDAICEAVEECRWTPDMEDNVMEKLREITEMVKEGRVG